MQAGNILITGPPGCGKSKLLEKLVRSSIRPLTGFFTREIRQGSRRVGFSITTLDGQTGLLAHEKTRSPYRVGRYGVNLDDLERIAVPSMVPSVPGEIVVIDEIGKMECFSELFRRTVLQVLESDHVVVGSIAQSGTSFIRSVRERPDVVLLRISPATRDTLLPVLLDAVDRASQPL